MELWSEKERIIQIIREMPEDEVRQVIDFVDDLDEDFTGPESVQIRDEESLRQFLDKGLDDYEKGMARSLSMRY